MCFSVEASFGASVFLLSMGLLSIKNLKAKNLWPLAVVPLLFAAQQFFEGFVWLNKAGVVADSIGNIAKYGFIFFAFIVWPFWIPFACWKTEKNRKNKQLLLPILAAGSVISLIFLGLVIYFGISVEATCNHLVYAISKSVPYSSAAINMMLFIYGIITLAPFFISSIKHMWILGVLTAASLLLAILLFYTCLISVWCFFAAIVSAFIYWIIKK